MAVVKKSLTLVYFPELIVKMFVSFAIQAVVIVCTLYALFKTFATGCMQFMRLFRSKLLLIYEPQTILPMDMHTATNLAIILVTSSDHPNRFLKCHLNRFFFQQIVQKRFIKTLRSFLQDRFFLIDCNNSVFVFVSFVEKDFG